MANNIEHSLISIAEAVRAKISYELNLKFDAAEFFKLKFQNDSIQTKKLCRVIFKLGNNGVQ